MRSRGVSGEDGRENLAVRGLAPPTRAAHLQHHERGGRVEIRGRRLARHAKLARVDAREALEVVGQHLAGRLRARHAPRQPGGGREVGEERAKS
eukprot:5752859-Prymnesium_polylepis.1